VLVDAYIQLERRLGQNAGKCGFDGDSADTGHPKPPISSSPVDSDLQLADPAEVAVAQEYLSLKSRIGEIRGRADRLRALADHLDEQARRDEYALREFEGALGLAAQLQIEQLDHELGGKRLQEIAVAVLSREIQPGQAVHYRDWYALLCAAGYSARGKDPLASFLAQINRAERVEPVGGRSGLYRLRVA
jgi:hypothetical protein